jgi:hypothetical protein
MNESLVVFLRADRWSYQCCHRKGLVRIDAGTHLCWVSVCLRRTDQGSATGAFGQSAGTRVGLLTCLHQTPTETVA